MESRATTPEKPDLMMTPEIENAILTWQQTGNFPFSDLGIWPAPMPQFYSFQDLRLIHHVASIASELSMQGASNFTIFAPQIPL